MNPPALAFNVTFQSLRSLTRVRRRTPARGRWFGVLLGILLVGTWAVADSKTQPAQKKQPPKKPAPQKPVAPPPPRSSLLTVEDWQKAPLTPLNPGEIDNLVAKELEHDKVEPAPLTADEQFLRRVSLDLTGELPLPADIAEFLADTNPQKRARLIDKLLDSEDYAKHWARYWRDVVVARLPDARFKFLAGSFEVWLAEQLKNNKSWGDIARAMITAEGEIRLDEPGKNGAAFFLAAHRGNDTANERAAETSRIFLGIQIQCAQCHDHPSDQWKRVQFHELAGYFARLRERPVKGAGFQGVELVSAPQGEHEMPSKEDPKKGLLTHPQFLNGHSPGKNLGDKERRKSLADDIVSKGNYWFAGAYVNRIWGELMGQSFYSPVDDMGPKKEAVFKGVLTRLTGSFRAGNYDMKGLFRDILNSQTYQRQIHLGESTDQHLHFAAAYPTRLRSDVLWESLVSVLGSLGPRLLEPPRPRPFKPGLEGLFQTEFEFDPSLKSDEVEGSITQVLLMMNNQAINNRIKAQGTNLLGRILTAYPSDDEALKMVYLRTLARKPTDREMDKCRQYLQKTGNRAEAFEDILWALLNSTEFQTKR
jgi:hypothetical protein